MEDLFISTAHLHFLNFMIQKYQLPAISDGYLKTQDAGTGCFPASRIQKGLILGLGDRDLDEEGVGFGLPVLKLGLQPVFPGSWRMSAVEENGLCLIRADFEMNLRVRMARRERIIENALFCLAWENFSRMHRICPPLRGWISTSSRALKEKLDLWEVFSKGRTHCFIRASYLIHSSGIDVELVFPGVDGCTELIVLNEQGANYFDTYRDSDGLILRGERIGSWNRTEADRASLTDPEHGLAFTMKQVEGARMFRGRELAAGSLAWSGLAYVIPPGTERFAYSIELEKA